MFKIRTTLITSIMSRPALFNVTRAVADKTPHTLRVSIESEAVVSQTNEMLGATVDSRQSTKTVAGSSAQPSDEQLHDLVDFWVARFVSRLDRANGYPADSSSEHRTQ